MANFNSYTELVVWQKSVKQVLDMYQICLGLPRDETFGLERQMKRSSISIPAKLTKGGSQSCKSYVQFLKISLGSLCKLETQHLIAKKLGLITDIKHLEEQISETSKMLNSWIGKIESKETSLQL